MSTVRYYYKHKTEKYVFVYDSSEPAGVNISGLDFIGSTNNPNIKMAVSTFLRGQSGYKILDYTNPHSVPELPSGVTTTEEPINDTSQDSITD